jgi:hypothetical protein
MQEEAQAATDALDPKHTWVPWVTVDGAPINVQQLRQASQVAQRVCKAFNGTKCALARPLSSHFHCNCHFQACCTSIAFRGVLLCSLESLHYVASRVLARICSLQGNWLRKGVQGLPHVLVLSVLLQARCTRRHLTMLRCVQAASMRTMTARPRCAHDCCMMYTSAS